MKEFVNAIIVVEGTHDVSRICSLFDVLDFVVTNGYDINEDDLAYLNSVRNYNVIILTDSDNSGKIIRNKICDQLTNYINVEVDISKCNKNNKKGVAECELSEINDKLKPFLSSKSFMDEITNADLFNLGLIGHENSKEMRNKISKIYSMGVCNSKNFIRRCTIKEITLEKLKNAD